MLFRSQIVSVLDVIGVRGDGGGGDNCSYKPCRAPVKLSPPTNQHPAFVALNVLPVADPTALEHQTNSSGAPNEKLKYLTKG